MEENDIQITGADKENLIQTARWGKFLAVLGFVFTGFMILIGFSIAGGGLDMPGMYRYLGIVYVLFALIYLFPSLYLFRFCTKIAHGIYAGDQQSCSEAFANLRKLFVFFGVATIIMLGIYFLVILAILGGASVGSFV